MIYALFATLFEKQSIIYFFTVFIPVNFGMDLSLQRKLDLKTILIGVTDTKCLLFNYLIVLGKLHLWNCRRNNSLPSFPSFKELAKQKYKTERLIALKCNYVIYYIDTSVLLENRPLVKLIRNYIRDPSGVFSISSLVRISMTSFPAFASLFVQSCQTAVEKWRAIHS